MIWYKTVLNINVPQMNLFLPIRNSTVETISKQLEYVTKGHVATQTIWFKFKTVLFFSSF